MEQALEEDPVDGNWVGCILVKDNKFYFGSYENQITGICLQQLRKVLGGNAKQKRKSGIHAEYIICRVV